MSRRTWYRKGKGTMNDELKAIIKENLDELERVMPADPARPRSEYGAGYKEGYKAACAHLLGVLERRSGSVQHPHILLGQRAGYSDEPSRGR